jgi:hypothetical protein
MKLRRRDKDNGKEEENGRSGDEAKKKEKEKDPMVPFFSMFRYATPFDRMLMIIGSLAAVANGSSMYYYLFYSPHPSVILNQKTNFFNKIIF